MPDASVNLGMTVTANISQAMQQMKRLSSGARGTTGSAAGGGGGGTTQESTRQTGALDRQQRSLAGVAARTEHLRLARQALMAGTLKSTLTERAREMMLQRLYAAQNKAVSLERDRRNAVELGNTTEARSIGVGVAHQRQLVAYSHALLKNIDARAVAGQKEGQLRVTAKQQMDKEFAAKEQAVVKEGQLRIRAKQQMDGELAAKEQVMVKEGQLRIKARQEMVKDFAAREQEVVKGGQLRIRARQEMVKDFATRKQVMVKDGQLRIKARQEMVKDFAARKQVTIKEAQLRIKARQEMVKDFAVRERAERKMVALHARAMEEYAKASKKMSIAGVARGGLAILGGMAKGARNVVVGFMHIYWAGLSIMYAVRNIVRPFTDLVRGMVTGFQRVLGYAKQLIGSLINISAEIEMLELRMRGLFGGAAGSGMMKWAMDTAVGLRFVWTDIANAMLKVQALGVEFLPKLGPDAVERVMPGIMDLAAMFGQSVEDAGAAVMKASTGFFMSLRRTYGIMPQQVVNYGGVAGPGGTLVGKTPEQQAQNLVAILNLIQARYGGMAKATSNTYKAVVDDMSDLWARFGKELKDIGFLRPITDALIMVRDAIMRITSTGERELSPMAQRIAAQFTQWSKRLRPVFMWFAERIEPMLSIISDWLGRIGDKFDVWYKKVDGIQGIMMTVMEFIIDHAPAAIGVFRTYLSLILTIGGAVLTVLQGAVEAAREVASAMGDVEKTEMFGRAAEAAEKAKDAIESIGERVGGPLRAMEEKVAKAGAWRRYYREHEATREEALGAAGRVMLSSGDVQGPPGYTYAPAGMPLGAGGAVLPTTETPLQRRNRESLEAAKKVGGVPSPEEDAAENTAKGFFTRIGCFFTRIWGFVSGIGRAIENLWKSSNIWKVVITYFSLTLLFKLVLAKQAITEGIMGVIKFAGRLKKLVLSASDFVGKLGGKLRPIWDTIKGFFTGGGPRTGSSAVAKEMAARELASRQAVAGSRAAEVIEGLGPRTGGILTRLLGPEILLAERLMRGAIGIGRDVGVGVGAREAERRQGYPLTPHQRKAIGWGPAVPPMRVPTLGERVGATGGGVPPSTDVYFHVSTPPGLDIEYGQGTHPGGGKASRRVQQSGLY